MRLLLLVAVVLTCHGVRQRRKATIQNRSDTEDVLVDPEAGQVGAFSSAQVTIIPSRQQVVEHLKEKVKPNDLLAKGFEALSPLMHKALRGQILTGKEVADAAASIGIAALGMINPLLGAFATFLWGFIGGGGGGNQLALMEKRILDKTKLLIRDSEYKSRVNAVKNSVLNVMDRIEECCDPETVARDDIKEIRNSLADKKRVVFGSCVDDPSGNPCKDWRTYNGGGFEALEYAIMYAQVQLNLDGLIAQLSTTSGGAKWAGELLQTDGRLYSKYIADHYNALFNYRMSKSRYTVQKYDRKKCLSYSNVFGCTLSTWQVSNNGNDEYLRKGFASSSIGCLTQGTQVTCKGDWRGGNYEKCSVVLPRWKSAFNNCITKHTDEIAAQMRSEFRPAAAKFCSNFGNGCQVDA